MTPQQTRLLFRCIWLMIHMITSLKQPEFQLLNLSSAVCGELIEELQREI